MHRTIASQWWNQSVRKKFPAKGARLNIEKPVQNNKTHSGGVKKHDGRRLNMKMRKKNTKERVKQNGERRSNSRHPRVHPFGVFVKEVPRVSLGHEFLGGPNTVNIFPKRVLHTYGLGLSFKTNFKVHFVTFFTH